MARLGFRLLTRRLVRGSGPFIPLWRGGPFHSRDRTAATEPDQDKLVAAAGL